MLRCALVNKTTMKKVTAKHEKVTFLVKTIPKKKHNLMHKLPAAQAGILVGRGRLLTSLEFNL